MIEKAFLVRLPLLALAGCVFASACGAPRASWHQYFPVHSSAVPPPGLCRIFSWSLRNGSAVRDCDDIEGAADVRHIILYRPDNESRHVVVCYMSDSVRGRIDDVEVFDIDTRRLVDVMQRHGEPPVRSCQNALWAFLWW